MNHGTKFLLNCDSNLNKNLTYQLTSELNYSKTRGGRVVSDNMHETKTYQVLDSFSCSVSSDKYHQAYHLPLQDPEFQFFHLKEKKVFGPENN